jgi:hypothetical protein
MQARDALNRIPANPTAADHDSAEAPLITLAERLGRTAAVARALILAGRTVDLAGIEDGVGLLCAKTLDLPRDQARHVLPSLHAVLEQLTSLNAALNNPGGD